MKKTLLIILLLVSASSLVLADSKVYFSPNGGCQDAIIAQIKKAKTSIDIAMYSFTAREIAQALVESKEHNVKVRIILDKAQKTASFSKSRYFINKGIEVKYHNGNGLMHNKFAVIDGVILITGSFNWTSGAEHKNEENLLILDERDTVSKFINRFESLWNKSVSGELYDIKK